MVYFGIEWVFLLHNELYDGLHIDDVGGGGQVFVVYGL